MPYSIPLPLPPAPVTHRHAPSSSSSTRSKTGGSRTGIGEVAHGLKMAIRARTALVTVVGLGYVGLPMALAFARAGFSVTGFDTNAERCEAVMKGKSYITDVDDADLQEMVESKKFSASSKSTVLEQADIVLICVPTPLRKSKDPDLAAIIEASDAVASRLRSGQLIILESTTYPGTTEDILLPRFARENRVVGEDFFLAFSPERIDPGNTAYGVHNITKLVGGVTPTCTEMAAEFYRQVVDKVVTVANPRVAEASKLLENTFRSVNIALANEMAIICAHLGIDVWEVIDAAGTKPFGFMAHYPGPGIGGHCIPLDPHYLSWRSRLSGYDPKFISLASEINSSMPEYVVQLITQGLNDQSLSVRDSRILLLGMAYKPNVSDYRESPAFEVLDLLLQRGAQVMYSDPHVPTVAGDDFLLAHQELTPTLVEESDCVVVLTHHKIFDYEMVVRKAPLVVDTRNITRPFASLGNVRFL